jgi:signal peptidase I
MLSKLTPLFIMSLMLSACSNENQNDAAHALFLDATTQISNAATAETDATAISMYREGVARLDAIVTKYPRSTLATQLASEQQIGTFSRSQVQKRFPVPSGSMKPTLLPGEAVVALKYPAGTAPKRGDVVVYFVPKGSGVLISRVIGLAGERVQMIDGIPYINEQPIRREPVDDYVDTEGGRSNRIKQWKEILSNEVSYNTLDLLENGFVDDTPIFTVPLGHYFVLGDNRDASVDSRFTSQVGPIPLGNTIGRVIKP